MNARTISAAFEPVMATRLSRWWSGATNAMRSQSLWLTIAVMMMVTLGIVRLIIRCVVLSTVQFDD